MLIFTEDKVIFSLSEALSFFCVKNSRYFFLSIRMWRRFDSLRGQFQFTEPPWLLSPQLPVCVGDPCLTPLLGADTCLLPDCRGAISLSVWLAGGAGADRAELCGHQVGQMTSVNQTLSWPFQSLHNLNLALLDLVAFGCHPRENFQKGLKCKVVWFYHLTPVV